MLNVSALWSLIISVHMISSYASDRFVVVWLLGTHGGFIIGTKQIRIHAVEGRGSPHIYTNM